MAHCGITFSGNLGRRARFRRHCQRDSAAHCAAVPHALGFRSSAAFSDKPGLTAYDVVRERLKAHHVGAADPEKFWRKTLNDGVVADTAFAPLSVALKFNPASLPPSKIAPAGQIEFIFRPDPNVHDGRFANNGWLQELREPVTKLTWDNAALVSPKAGGEAAAYTTRRGPWRRARPDHSNVIDIAISNSKVTAAAWIVPGQADGVVVLPLGYGRKKSWLHRHEQRIQRVCRAHFRRAMDCHGRRRRHQENRRRVSAGLHPVSLQHGRPQDSGHRHARGIPKKSEFCHEGDEQPPKEMSLYKEFSYPRICLGHGH